MTERPLLVVDGDNLTHRAYHSTPKTVVGPGGEPLNAIVGFFSMLMRVVEAEQPRGVFVGWDTLGVDTYRSELWPGYQGGRIFDPEIKVQLNRLPELCLACNLEVGKEAGFEADDLMAAATHAETAAGGSVLLFTTDKDSYQLVSDKVTMIAPQKGTRELDRIHPHEVVARFGILPEQVPDFKALSGDPSDKIPGAKGIGPKAAAALLLRYGDLEGVLENWGRPDESDRIRLFGRVTRMRLDAVVTLPLGPANWRGGADVLRAAGALNLADRMSA